MRTTELEDELRRRAEHYLRQTQLVVDYYRIRRRLAYPLPLRRLVVPGTQVPGIPNYPWLIWLSWELEERIGALGNAGEILKLSKARTAAKRDLVALAEWPGYRQFDKLDLCTAHFARTMAMAMTKWRWLGAELRGRLGDGLRRLVDQNAPLVLQEFGRFQTADDILAQPDPHRLVHNIRLIAAAGITVAAHVAGHPIHKTLNAHLRTAVEAWLALRKRGLSEGVAYDGYILDFLVGWFETLSPTERNAFLHRPHIAWFVGESCAVGAPGDWMNVPAINDVEPRQMPFHVSAQAKIQLLRPHALRAWYLERCRLDWLRADALAALRGGLRMPRGKALNFGPFNAHCALVLRSGLQESDVAVVIGASNSPAHHVHCSNGSLVIGTRKHWFITAPGYQQYMPNSEREFTIGVASRNTPVINGQNQTAKAARRLALETVRHGVQRAALDLTRCYPQELNLRKLVRTVWLADRRFIVVADAIAGPSMKELTYHWHGHPEAAWSVEDGWATIHLAGTTLRFCSPQTTLTDAHIQRLRGSRGQLTLRASMDMRMRVIWWVFAFGEPPPTVRLSRQGNRVRVGTHSFRGA